MSSVECKHGMTKGRDGEDGLWCVECGVKVWGLETRPCSDCKHSNNSATYVGWTCRKLSMGVAPNMRVTFRIKDGTCWESE